MSKKSTLIILSLVALLSYVVVRASSDRNIIINNRIMPLTEIDSITFSASGNSAYQTLWKNGVPSSSDASCGQQTLILPYNVNDSVYSLGSDANWTNVYLTPAGFFYYGAYGRRLPIVFEGDIQSANGGYHDTWYYESFDGMSSALMLFAKDKNVFTLFEHNDGFVTAHSDEDNNYEIIHVAGETERESFLSFSLESDTADYTGLHDILMGVTLQYRDYRPSDFDPEFVRLLQLFESLLDVPAAKETLQTTPAVDEKKYQATAKLEKKKFHSSRFTIRFETSEIAFPHSAHGATVFFKSNEFKCASSLAIEKVEYWYLLDENPDSLTINKADHKYHIEYFSQVPYHYFIRFQDLKPSKTYYYTSYVKIPKNQVGAYVFKFGDRKATEKYGETYSVQTMDEYRLEMKSSHKAVEDFSLEIDALGEPGNFTAFSDKENLIWMKDVKGWATKYNKYFIYADKGQSSWHLPIRLTYFKCPICGWNIKYYGGNSRIYFDENGNVNISHHFFDHVDGLYDENGNYVKDFEHGSWDYILASTDFRGCYKTLSSIWRTPDSHYALSYYYNVQNSENFKYRVYSCKGFEGEEDGYVRTPGYSDEILPPLLPEQFQIRIQRVSNETD